MSDRFIRSRDRFGETLRSLMRGRGRAQLIDPRPLPPSSRRPVARPTNTDVTPERRRTTPTITPTTRVRATPQLPVPGGRERVYGPIPSLSQGAMCPELEQPHRSHQRPVNPTAQQPVLLEQQPAHTGILNPMLPISQTLPVFQQPPQFTPPPSDTQNQQQPELQPRQDQTFQQTGLTEQQRATGSEPSEIERPTTSQMAIHQQQARSAHPAPDLPMLVINPQNSKADKTLPANTQSGPHSRSELPRFDKSHKAPTSIALIKPRIVITIPDEAEPMPETEN